mmetsp:Transcript_80314/g.173641  ORF Transcript_80314/g.173641 Transcript_80314/m.173641 type:complete len:117 (-) Transcript_80314:1693-2043(-)|eukprot:CAMPEP_0116902242 /NCGR_PEP_ID=MMETSP0467-20121206/9895_1 /TAXON_ID=283647 /ORGANISM="Mesodinium pulex, Strain SPMC105" /LENGTH=116 /DNA_ID=CAMNT_0004576035 /DNA_START=1470 /DNA_END=1820 /DNA_ORIENTATION=-
MARNDDVIKVAGHRLSTGRLEEVIGGVQGVAECAVVAKADALKGATPLAFVVLQMDLALLDVDAQTLLDKSIKSEVRSKVGAIASLDSVVFVHKLPKTRSAKILRKLLKQIADGTD